MEILRGTPHIFPPLCPNSSFQESMDTRLQVQVQVGAYVLKTVC